MGKIIHYQVLCCGNSHNLQFYVQQAVHKLNARHDSNHGTSNARPMRTKSCVMGGKYNRQRMPVIRIMGTTLANNSAIASAILPIQARANGSEGSAS